MEEQNTKTKGYFKGHRTRLRNRFLLHGIESLEEHEVIELFLTFVIPQMDVKKSAHNIIKIFGSVKGFFEAESIELKKISYVKEKAITLIKFIKEISLLYQKQLVEEIPLTKSKEELIQYCIKKLGFLKEEELWLISLDSKYAIIKENLISKGLTDKGPVYPRKVLEIALYNKAYSILLLHNHPNGNPQPSDYDINITQAIEIPAKVLNISIFDHFIIANDKYFSLRDNGMI